MQRLMDIDELARYLKLRKQTIYIWLRKRRVPAMKVGHVWRFDRKSIDKWLKSQVVSIDNKKTTGE